MKARFQERVKGVDYCYAIIKNGISKAFDEVCGKKNGRRDHGITSWLNEVEEIIRQKKVACKKMFVIPS